MLSLHTQIKTHRAKNWRVHGDEAQAIFLESAVKRKGLKKEESGSQSQTLMSALFYQPLS